MLEKNTMELKLIKKNRNLCTLKAKPLIRVMPNLALMNKYCLWVKKEIWTNIWFIIAQILKRENCFQVNKEILMEQISIINLWMKDYLIFLLKIELNLLKWKVVISLFMFLEINQQLK